jgi:hypothetical protein
VSQSRTGASDTDPAIEAMIILAHRAMSSREKMLRVLACNEASEAMAMAGLRSRHGSLPEPELRLRLAALRLPRETMRAAFGWDEPAAVDG